MLSENSPSIYFSFTGQCMQFLKCMVPFPLNSSISFPPASSVKLTMATCSRYWITCQNAAKHLWFTGLSMHCFFDGEQFGYLGVCMEIRVAHIVMALCPKQSFIHSSFAFTSLDHVTFCLQQYMFKNWLLKLCLCAYQHQSSILSLLGTLLQNLLLATKQTSLRSSFLWWRHDGNFH